LRPSARGCVNPSLNLRKKIALLCEAVEWSIEPIDLRVTLKYLDRPVDTSAVNDHDTARPRQLLEGARDIRRLIERDDQRCDCINHSAQALENRSHDPEAVMK
jgi:hypothetical protein